MDYTTEKMTFKVKKLLRYIRLYGLGRTLIKVQSVREDRDARAS